MDELPQYSPPGSFEGGNLGFQPISLRLTPKELIEMQKIVEDLDVEDQREKSKLKTTLAIMHGNIAYIHYSAPIPNLNLLIQIYKSGLCN